MIEASISGKEDASLGKEFPYLESRRPSAKRPGAKDAVEEKVVVDPESLNVEEAMDNHGEVIKEVTLLGGKEMTVEGKHTVAKRRLNKKGAEVVGGRGGGGGGQAPSTVAGRPKTSILECFPRPSLAPPTEGPRIIVFIAGGLTLTETLALERLSEEKGRDIVVGGTSFLTPKDFLGQLEMVRAVSPSDGLSPIGKQNAGGSSGFSEIEIPDSF